MVSVAHFLIRKRRYISFLVRLSCSVPPDLVFNKSFFLYFFVERGMFLGAYIIYFIKEQLC